MKRRGSATRALIVAAFALSAATTAGRASDSAVPSAVMPPAETFAELPFLSDPVLSPDGRSIAARTLSAGKTRLSVFDADNPGQAPHNFELGGHELADINWAGPHRLLLTMSMTMEVFGISFPATRLIAVDVRTNAATPLDRKSSGLFAGNVLYTDPDGAWILVSSQSDMFATPSVKRIDLETGAVTVVEKARPNVWDWYADGAGVVRAGIAYSGNRWTIWYRDKAGDPLVAVKGKREKNDDAGMVDSLRFLSADNSGLIVTNSRTGRFAAYHYDFATGTIGDAIYENPQVDISTVLVDPLTGVVSGVKYEDDRRRVVWLDPKMHAIQTRVEKALPGAEDVVRRTPAPITCSIAARDVSARSCSLMRSSPRSRSRRSRRCIMPRATGSTSRPISPCRCTGPITPCR